MTRRTVGILAGIVIILSGALLTVPVLIDWSRFRDGLTEAMENALGQSLSIEGGVSFSVLPSPSFSVENVTLLRDAGTAGGMEINLPRLQIRPRLLPLFAGRLEISSLVLVSPDIRLTLPPDVPERLWTGTASNPPPGDHPGGPGAGGPAAPIDRITIENGRISYQPPGREPMLFDKLGASLITQPEGGGRVVGTVRSGGLDLGFDGVLGSASAGQPAPFSLTVTTTQGGGSFRVGGQIAGSGADRKFTGKLSAKAGDLARIVSDQAGGDATFPPIGNAGIEAAVRMVPGEIDLDKLTVAIGVLEGNGTASFAFGDTPQADVKLSFGRFDLDSMLSGLRAQGQSGRAAGPGAGASPGGVGDAASADAIRLPKISLPSGLSASVDLGASVVVFRGGLLRGAHVNAALVNGEVTLNQASLSLPGNTDVNLFGFLVSPDGVPAFDGSFEAASDDVRGLLDWLGIDASGIPADRLHGMRLAGKARARPSEIDLDGMQIRLDGTRADAALSARLAERPALGVSFAIDTLNLDAYWPSRRPDPADSGTVGQDGAAHPAAAGPDLSWLGRLDADIKGKVGQMTVRGATAKGIDFDGGWRAGRFSVSGLSVADMGGASLRLDGAVEGLAEGTPALRAVHYALEDKQPETLVRLFGLSLPVDPARLGPVSLTGTLDGGLDGLNLDMRNSVAGGVAAFSGKLENPLVAPRFEGRIDITHGSALQVIGLFAPSYRPSGALGPLALTSQASFDAGGVRLSGLDLKIGALGLAGEASLALGDRPRVDAKLDAGDIAIDALLPQGHKADRSLPAQSQPPRKEEPRHGLPAFATDKVSAAPRDHVVSGAIPERWSSDPVDLSWLKAADGSVVLVAKSLTFGRNRMTGVSAGVDLTGGALALSRLGGQLFGGDLSGGGRLTADGQMALQLALAHAQARQALFGVADVDVAEGSLDADLSLSSAGLSPAEWVGRLAGAGKLAIRDGEIHGFDLKAVDDRLRGAADNPLGLLNLLQTGLTGGRTHFSALTGNARVANGMIVADDLRLDADGGGAAASLQVNLPAYVMDGHADFHLASAPSGPPLVMRISGPLDGPRRFVDINAMQQWLVGRTKAVKPKDLLKGALKALGR